MNREMKNYTLRFAEDDQHLIDTTCMFPEAVEAFAFIPCPGGQKEVSTINKDRFDRWIKALKSNGREFEIVK